MNQIEQFIKDNNLINKLDKLERRNVPLNSYFISTGSTIVLGKKVDWYRIDYTPKNSTEITDYRMVANIDNKQIYQFI